MNLQAQYGATCLKAFNHREQSRFYACLRQAVNPGQAPLSMIICGTVCGEDFTGNTLKYVQTGKLDEIKSQAIFLDHNNIALVSKIYCLVKDLTHAVPHIVKL
jgi:hypothetical protein